MRRRDAAVGASAEAMLAAATSGRSLGLLSTAVHWPDGCSSSLGERLPDLSPADLGGPVEDSSRTETGGSNSLALGSKTLAILHL